MYRASVMYVHYNAGNLQYANTPFACKTKSTAIIIIPMGKQVAGVDCEFE